MCLRDFFFLLAYIYIARHVETQHYSLITKQLKQPILPCSFLCTASIRKLLLGIYVQHIKIGYIPENLRFRYIFFNARSLFGTIEVRIHQLYYHSTLRGKQRLVNTHSYEQELVQWHHMLSANIVITTTGTSLGTFCSMSTEILAKIVSLTYHIQILLSNNSGDTHRHFNKTLSNSFHQLLYTLFHNRFCSPYFFINSLMVFSNILFSFSNELNLFPSCLTDTVIVFEVISCSDGFRSEFSLDTR